MKQPFLPRVYDLHLNKHGWVNSGEAGDLRRHRVHYDVNVTIMRWTNLTNPTIHLHISVPKWCIAGYWTPVHCGICEIGPLRLWYPYKEAAKHVYMLLLVQVQVWRHLLVSFRHRFGRSRFQCDGGFPSSVDKMRWSLNRGTESKCWCHWILALGFPTNSEYIS